MIRVVSIKFRDAGRLYDFDAGDLELDAGDQIVVETERGRALGTVIFPPRQVALEELTDTPKKVLRPATEEDVEMANRFKDREHEAYKFCQARIEERRMEMKLVQAEYLFDGSKIIFYFTADGRVDFRELVKDLAHYFHTRIEMRQIGVRDEAKLLGGIGVCGRELCCSTFLREFNPVSVKMAKEQGLALNPSKISGQCGRLLCCLGYEYETYCHLKRGLPKIGRIITVGDREAQVVSLDIFSSKVKVRFKNGEEAHLSAKNIERGELPSPPAAPQPEKETEPQPENKPSARREESGDSADQKPKRRRRGRSRGRGKKKEGAQGGDAQPGGSSSKQESGKTSQGQPEKSDQSQRTKGRGPEDKGKGPEGQKGQSQKNRTGEKKRRPRRRPPRKKE